MDFRNYLVAMHWLFLENIENHGVEKASCDSVFYLTPVFVRHSNTTSFFSLVAFKEKRSGQFNSMLLNGLFKKLNAMRKSARQMLSLHKLGMENRVLAS